MLIVITTYNRNEHCWNLVKDIFEQGFTGEVIIFDDGSDIPIVNNNCTVIRYDKPHGKRGYYRLVSDVFAYLSHQDFKYFWMLPDDIRLKPDFFTLSIGMWNAIQDEKKICLSVGHDGQRHYSPCWTKFQPIHLGDVVLTQFVDMCFMAEKKLIEVVPEIEKPKNGYNYASSGVGRFISRTLFMRHNLYFTNSSLVEFIPIETQMHKTI